MPRRLTAPGDDIPERACPRCTMDGIEDAVLGLRARECTHPFEVGNVSASIPSTWDLATA